MVVLYYVNFDCIAYYVEFGLPVFGLLVYYAVVNIHYGIRYDLRRGVAYADVCVYVVVGSVAGRVDDEYVDGVCVVVVVVITFAVNNIEYTVGVGYMVDVVTISVANVGCYNASNT